MGTEKGKNCKKGTTNRVWYFERGQKKPYMGRKGGAKQNPEKKKKQQYGDQSWRGLGEKSKKIQEKTSKKKRTVEKKKNGELYKQDAHFWRTQGSVRIQKRKRGKERSKGGKFVHRGPTAG